MPNGHVVPSGTPSTRLPRYHPTSTKLLPRWSAKLCVDAASDFFPTRRTAHDRPNSTTLREKRKRKTMPIETSAKRMPPRPEQIIAEQKRRAAKAHAEEAASGTAVVPTSNASTAVALPDSRTAAQKYIDENAPSSIVGRLVKFTKDGVFTTADDGEPVSEDADFIALCDETLVGWIKFNGKDEPPDRVMGLLYSDFRMPMRDSLGDTDASQWEERTFGNTRRSVEEPSLSGAAKRRDTRTCSRFRPRRQPDDAPSATCCGITTECKGQTPTRCR